ncbi:MAG: hypothetical protein GX879_00730 [Bacteroidales bacterium]|nr:hypothetical protein [Bacteroidales bacterium]
MKINKITIIVEYTWLAMAAFCLVVGIIKTMEWGIKYSSMFYIMAFICVAMFVFRRLNRKNLERRNNKFKNQR